MQGMRVAAEPPFRTSLCYRVRHDTGCSTLLLLAAMIFPMLGMVRYDSWTVCLLKVRLNWCPTGKHSSNNAKKSQPNLVAMEEQ